jgi:hypothetical protein
MLIFLALGIVFIIISTIIFGMAYGKLQSKAERTLVDKLLRFTEILDIPVEFCDSEKDPQLIARDAAGLCLYDSYVKNRKIILDTIKIRIGHPKTKALLTLSHEVGHVVIALVDKVSTDEPNEAKADTISVALLHSMAEGHFEREMADIIKSVRADRHIELDDKYINFVSYFSDIIKRPRKML